MSRENRIPLLFVVAGAMLLMMLIKANAGEPGANQRPTTEVMSPATAPPPQPQWQPQLQQAPPQVYREVVREISLVTQYRYVEVEKPVYRDREVYVPQYVPQPMVEEYPVFIPPPMPPPPVYVDPTPMIDLGFNLGFNIGGRRDRYPRYGYDSYRYDRGRYDRYDYDRYDRYDRYRPSYRPSYRPRYDNYRPRYGGQSYHHHDHCD